MKALALRAASSGVDVARLSFDLPRAGAVSHSLHGVRGRRIWQGTRTVPVIGVE